MTLDLIEKLAINKTLYDRGRGSVKGLHVRNLNGNKHFYLTYRTKAGKQRRPKIGVYPQDSIEQVRIRAASIMGKVFLGEDPKGDWDNSKHEMTLQELFDSCWKRHWDKPRYQQSGWAKNVMQLYTAYLKKPFGALGLSEVTPKRIRMWHGDYLLEGVYSGNRSLNVLVKLFNHAQEMEYVPQGINPATLVKAHPEAKRGRYATEDEMAQIIDYLEDSKFTAAGVVTYIYILIYTGARPQSIERLSKRALHWDADDWGSITFRGKDSKYTGEDDQLLFPPVIKELIYGNKENKTGFITPVKMHQVRYFWTGMCKELGIEGLWLRDLRRTFATLGLTSGVSIDHIGRLLNHKSQQTTLTYAKLITETRKNALTAITGVINDHIRRKHSSK